MEETGFFNSSQEIGWKLEQNQELLQWWDSCSGFHYFMWGFHCFAFLRRKQAEEILNGETALIATKLKNQSLPTIPGKD